MSSGKQRPFCLGFNVLTFSALLAICAGNSPLPGEFPAQRPVTRTFDVYFDLHLNKQSWDWWFETLSSPLWRHSDAFSGHRNSGNVGEDMSSFVLSSVYVDGLAPLGASASAVTMMFGVRLHTGP